MKVHDAIRFLRTYRIQHPRAGKDEIADAAAADRNLELRRKVYVGDGYAIRFSSCSGSSFSNGVLSLSALHAYDSAPFIVCVVRPSELTFLLANTTFLKKISHSSHQLRIDNVRGTFLGHDIIRCFEDIENVPDNFDRLWALHREFTWEDNLARLVEATTNIAPTGTRFEPTEAEKKRILAAPQLAQEIAGHESYQRFKQHLAQVVLNRQADILTAAAIDNVNVRGNRIEQAITGGGNAHSLGDLTKLLDGGVEIHLEIKTKLLDRASSPKAYNIDKALELLSRGNTAIVFCFVGLDPVNRRVTTSTLLVFDTKVLDATRVQFHWAGRNSRGVTQLTGDLSAIFQTSYREQIDVPKSIAFLEDLLAIKEKNYQEG